MSDITVTRYDGTYKDEWNDFVSKAKNGVFLFNRNYMDYHNDRFTDHSLIFKRDENIVAILPANESDGMLISHGGLTYGGLLVDSSVKQHTVNNCISVLLNYLKEAGFEKLIYKHVPHVFHKQPAEEDLYALHRNGGTISEVTASTIVNLKEPLKMPKGRKAQISRAKREGVEIKLLEKKEDYECFINLENEVLRTRHGVKAVHTAEELFLLHSNFPNNIHLYGAIKDGAMIAGTVVYEYDMAVHTQYMASSDLGRNTGALDLAIATVINDYMDTKLWLDFGISTEEHGKVLNEGLISQKEGFGGRTNVYMVWMVNVAEKTEGE